MISRPEFDVLIMLIQNPQIDENKYFNQIKTLIG